MSSWTSIDDRTALVRFVTDRVADRLVEAGWKRDGDTVRDPQGGEEAQVTAASPRPASAGTLNGVPGASAPVRISSCSRRCTDSASRSPGTSSAGAAVVMRYM